MTSVLKLDAIPCARAVSDLASSPPPVAIPVQSIVGCLVADDPLLFTAINQQLPVVLFALEKRYHCCAPQSCVVDTDTLLARRRAPDATQQTYYMMHLLLLLLTRISCV